MCVLLSVAWHVLLPDTDSKPLFKEHRPERTEKNKHDKVHAKVQNRYTFLS